MSIKKNINIFEMSEEISVNRNAVYTYAVGWEYGRNHGLPIWLEFVNQQTWSSGMEFIHNNPINTSFEIPLEGYVNIIVDDIKYTVGKGELLILPRGEPNKIFSKLDEECRKLAFGFSGTLLDLILSSVNLNTTGPLRLKDVSRIYELVERGRIMLEQKREEDVPALAALAIEIIMEISQQCSTYNSPLIANAIYIMNFNINHKISLDEIAKQLKISSQKLISIFKQELNETPMRYLINLRMNEAENLLSNSRITINEIAARTGYSSASRFIREFKKRFNISPSAYRKKMKK